MRSSDAGFTLVETVVAAGVLAVGLVSLSQLVVIATHVTMAAGTLTTSAVMAQQKMEQLRAIDWDALALSPPGALDEDIPGYVEYLDADGRVRGDPDPTVVALFVRRWAIAAVSDHARVIQVVVRRQRLVPTVGAGIDECRLTSIRSRPSP